MRKKLPLKIFTLIFAISLCFVFFTKQSQAQEGGLQLRVSPPILDIEIEPGDSYSDYIKFTNLSTTETLTLYPQILSFRPLGEEGGQEFFEDSEENKTYALSQWINIAIDVVEIEPLERIVLPFSITVPEDAEAGGRYAAILLSNQPVDPEDLGNAVALGAKSGTIILARIAGETTESALIKEFSVGKELYDYLPVEFNTVVENTGNIHVKPVGSIEISNIFGNVVEELEVNESSGNVLPDSTRKFVSTWEKEGFTLGKFTATLTLNYGEQADNYITDTVSFWVIPTREVVIALAVLIILIILIVVIIKSYNKMIVKKALEMQQKNQVNPPVQQ